MACWGLLVQSTAWGQDTVPHCAPGVWATPVPERWQVSLMDWCLVAPCETLQILYVMRLVGGTQ